VKYTFFTFDGNKKRLFFDVPKMDYCDLLRGFATKLRIVKKLIDDLRKFGNIITPCPMQPGYYYLNQFWIDETTFPGYGLLRDNLLLMFQLKYTDENAVKPIYLMDAQIFVRYNKTQWP
jgi:hypothetical protein